MASLCQMPLCSCLLQNWWLPRLPVATPVLLRDRMFTSKSMKHWLSVSEYQQRNIYHHVLFLKSPIATFNLPTKISNSIAAKRWDFTIQNMAIAAPWYALLVLHSTPLLFHSMLYGIPNCCSIVCPIVAPLSLHGMAHCYSIVCP